MTSIDLKAERTRDVDRIKGSVHPRKIVVAGPGTGKSYLFSEIIKMKRAEGKKDFLAITFIGKLGDALADDLCGLADTMTMHGYARRFFLDQCRGWLYYPRMYELIRDDLEAEGIAEFSIGDDNYKRKTKEYKAVGDADVVQYAVEICKKDRTKIPKHDLILIDEYQDFNAIESEFVDLLAQKNEIVIVGDDDQALYAFKGSSPQFIRDKFAPENADFESHTLRFCSRCTEAIIKYFHKLVEGFDLNDPANKRIKKDYICYAPDKDGDSRANPKIHVIKNCPVGMIAYKVKAELEKLTEQQKVKDVLIIGEGRSCEALLKGVVGQLRNYGFRDVDYKDDASSLPIHQDVVDAYKFISKDKLSVLGWRILKNPEESEKEGHIANAKTLMSIISGTPAKLKELKDDAIHELEIAIQSAQIADKKIRRDVLFRQIKRRAVHLARPLCNLNITVCNILNSKGLGADIVFLIGFDQGRFPTKKEVTDSEIYQMLVAVTRAKKRLYLINTVGKSISSFADYIDAQDLAVDVIEVKAR